MRYICDHNKVVLTNKALYIVISTTHLTAHFPQPAVHHIIDHRGTL